MELATRGVAWMLLLSCAPMGARGQETPWKPLFNGKDLSGWDTVLGRPPGAQTPLGLNNDPEGIFSVVPAVDGAPAIRILGKVIGALTTKEEFENYHLRVEYKWGPAKWPPRDKMARDSGVLYHCVGEPSSRSGWMTSIEYGLLERCGTGDWWVIGPTQVDMEGEPIDDPAPSEGAPIRYRRGGRKYASVAAGGLATDWDWETPYGDWNVAEVLAHGSTGVHVLNGRVNMILTNLKHAVGGKHVPLTRGKIQIQSEFAEVFYRKIEIRPIAAIPEEYFSAARARPVDEEGFMPLSEKDHPGEWVQGGPGLSWFRRKRFKNFILKGESRGSGAAVHVRIPDPGDDPSTAFKKGHAVEIAKAGSEWSDYEIACVGRQVTVRINGEVVRRSEDTEGRPLRGFIGLRKGSDAASHRNLRVRELPEQAVTYRVLFEGDLKEWTHDGTFEAKGGALTGRGLAWRRQPLADMVVLLDWKSERPEDEASVVLGLPDTGEADQGLHIPLRGTLGRWNSLELWVHGARTIAFVNGVQSHEASAKRAPRGHLGLHVPPSSKMAFRNIRAVELK